MTQATQTKPTSNLPRDSFGFYADKYDSIVTSSKYTAPVKLCETLCSCFGAAVQNCPDILDIGAGTGKLGEALKAEITDCRITGADLSPPMLDIAKGKSVYERLAQADLSKNFPFEDGSFDFVVSAGATEYIGVPGLLLSEMARVSRAPHRICSTFMLANTHHSRYLKFASTYNRQANKPAFFPTSAISQDALRKLCKQTGLHIHTWEEFMPYKQTLANMFEHQPTYILIAASASPSLLPA